MLLSPNIMIRLFYELCKHFSQNKLHKFNDLDVFNTFIANIDTSKLVCSNCGAKHSLVFWANYKRHLLTYHNGKVIDNIVSIPRFKCKSCPTTHAIIPPVLIPYKSYSFSFVVSMIYDYVTKKFKSVEVLSEHYDVSLRTFYRILNNFKLNKKLWLGLLESNVMSVKDFISKIRFYSYKEIERFACEFFSRFKISLFQKNVNFGVP
jgi:hypothetical protein